MGSSDSGRKCARCGISLNDTLSVEGLCIGCFLKERAFLEDRLKTVEIDYCGFCGRVKVGTIWRMLEEREFLEFISHRYEKILDKIITRYGLRIEDFFIEKFIDKNAAQARLVLAKGHMSEELSITVKPVIREVICPYCSKRKTGVHSAIIQVRSTELSLSDIEKLVEKAISKLPERVIQAVTEVELLEEGFDVKTIDQSSARMIASKIASLVPSEISESYKLVSIKGSERISRLTISLRLYSNRKKWSLGEYGNSIILYRIDSGKEIKIIELSSTPRKTTLPPTFQDKIKPFRGHAKDVVIISKTPTSVFVMGEKDYSFFTEIPMENIVGEPKPGSKALYIAAGKNDFVVLKNLLKDNQSL